MKSSKVTRVFFTVVFVIFFLVLLWEGYKWMGQQTDDLWPGTNFGLPIATNDTIMPVSYTHLTLPTTPYV